MRKTKTVTIAPEGGRDAGKTFIITEMPARQAEKWADRAFLALANSSVNFPAGIERGGMSSIAQIAYLMGGLKFPELDPLMDELLRCARIIPDTGNPGFTRDLLDAGAEGDDIEEVRTRQFLRKEILDLHANFSLAAVVLTLIAAASEMKTFPVSENTQTSPKRSGRSSRAA